MKSKQIKSTNTAYPSAVNNKVVESKEYNNLQNDVKDLYPGIVSYSTSVPFGSACSVVHHTPIADDELSPNTYAPLVGGGAIYVLTGNGINTPTFASTFSKNISSGDYVNTLGTINLITFLYDGVNYWYNITQPVI